MLRRGAETSGLMVLGSLLVFGQLGALVFLVIKLVDFVPPVQPVRVYTSETRLASRHDRTVQLPRANEVPDETTDNVP